MASGSASLAGVRVLVVEDESLVSLLLEDQLADMGCEVVGTASRFDDAAKKAASLAFDIAILDVNLNGRYTFEIAEMLAKRDAPFIFSTGYGATGLPGSLHWAPVLQKPFLQQDLERAIRAALA